MLDADDVLEYVGVAVTLDVYVGDALADSVTVTDELALTEADGLPD